MLPSVLESVYQSLKREEARDYVTQLFLVNQASNGTEQSIKGCCDHLSVWISEPGKGRNNLAKFRGAMMGKKVGGKKR